MKQTIQDAFKNTEYVRDVKYHGLYDEAMEACQMPGDNSVRRMRFWNLMKWYQWNQHINLPTAECGVYRGMSSYMMQSLWPSEHHVFDSFKGLSMPMKEDEGTVHHAGKFACDLQEVQRNLIQWGDIHYYEGWVPECFEQFDPDRWLRFVHIDVDLYAPIYDSLSFFWPRLCKGGVIVIDDYGYRDFPGAKKAVIEFCKSEGISWVPLSTGNAVIIKTDDS